MYHDDKKLVAQDIELSIRRLVPRQSEGGNGGNSYGSYGSGNGQSSYSSYGSSSSSYSNANRLPSYSNNYNSPSSQSYARGSHYNNNNGPYHGDPLHIPLAWVILLILATNSFATLMTAYKFEYDPEGNFANFCRLCMNTFDCVWKLIYNLYHCRLNEIPTVVSAAEDDDDEYTEQELRAMKPRRGIGRALEVEHQKSMRKAKNQGTSGRACTSQQMHSKSMNKPKPTTRKSYPPSQNGAPVRSTRGNVILV